MVNPFEKRATEYCRDDEAFLAFITPEPLATFLATPAREERLYDRLVVIVGTPGSGKTTLARLFQFPTLLTLRRNRNLQSHKPLIDILSTCGALSSDLQPTLAASRLPLEAEYRDYWEFPYPDDLKTGLMISMLQARAVLGWLRNFASAGVALDKVQIIPRADADAALVAIGGLNGTELQKRAREVELSIYKISAALIPPDSGEIDPHALSAYNPFDVIESFSIAEDEVFVSLRPLVIFDDAHSLHPCQFAALRRWLVKRELKVSRWVLTRLDALTPADVFAEQGPGEPGINRGREITEIWLQSKGDRINQRRAFRKMAKDMANRYLRQMDVFSRRGLYSLSDLLSSEPDSVPASQCGKLTRKLASLQRRYGVSNSRRNGLEDEVARYMQSAGELGEDVRLSMLAILLERYAKRTPQLSLFEDNAPDADPSRPLVADSSVAEGARLHLLHEFRRPYYFGIDTLCDASSENAEQFLQLAAQLVAHSETQLIRGNVPTLHGRLQNKLLREKAAEIIRAWDFPHHERVQRLAQWIAADCVAKTLEPNAPLGGGASAIGIPQEEFEAIPSVHPELARILQFGVAYNAFGLVPNYGTKKRLWCLIELGGILLLHHGLTLHRGGFLERRADDLLRALEES